jgi:hypothetical protein
MVNERLKHNLPEKSFERSPSNNDRLGEDEISKIKIAIGKRLVEALDTENFSEIGRKLKITAMNAKFYVEGTRFPSPEVQLQFRRVTGISIDWLMTGEGAKYVKFENVFSFEDEEEIKRMARENGRSFLEQAARLASAGLKFLEKLNSWKKD